MRLEIHRNKGGAYQILGKGRVVLSQVMRVYTDNFDFGFNFKTLELPWKNNHQNISCIPAGIYECKKRWSWKHKRHIEILDVPNRTNILIHAGNYYTDIRGCILCGDSFGDIDFDGEADIKNSKKTLKKLLSILPYRFELVIYDEKEGE